MSQSNQSPKDQELQLLGAMLQHPGWRLLKRWAAAQAKAQTDSLLAIDPANIGKVGGYQRDIARLRLFLDDDQLTKAISTWLDKDD